MNATVTIYQINPDRDAHCEFLFNGFTETTGPRSIYDAIYSFPCKVLSRPEEHLDNIFFRFNMSHPADYKGRSPFVSDVVEFVFEDGTVKSFFCAMVGWREIDFTAEK